MTELMSRNPLAEVAELRRALLEAPMAQLIELEPALVLAAELAPPVLSVASLEPPWDQGLPAVLGFQKSPDVL